jgi:hypothetical protein
MVAVPTYSSGGPAAAAAEDDGAGALLVAEASHVPVAVGPLRMIACRGAPAP